MDPTQIVIIISLISISVVIVIAGIYLITILSELKKLLTGLKPIISDTQTITSSVAKPVSSISEFVMGFKNGLNIINTFFPKDK
jgi:hypothetical protein